jgi:chemotaxis signal transduction protein
MMNSSMDTEQAAENLTPSVEAAPLAPAQGIQCGALNLAFPYTWARAIIEDFSLTPVPNAPVWMMGAANVEGEIVPVFDLASWVEADARVPAEPASGRGRLLVGGHEGDRAAIFFSGPARMVRYAPGGRHAVDETRVPQRLRAAVLSMSEVTPPHWVVDAQRLLDTLANELAP